MKKYCDNIAFHTKKIVNFSNVIRLSTGEYFVCVILCEHFMLNSCYKSSYCFWKMLTEKQIALN